MPDFWDVSIWPAAPGTRQALESTQHATEDDAERHATRQRAYIAQQGWPYVVTVTPGMFHTEGVTDAD